MKNGRPLKPELKNGFKTPFKTQCPLSQWGQTGRSFHIKRDGPL